MDILKLLRLQQWSKNLTIYVVLLASGNYDFELFKDLSIVFIGFSLIVSSTYIVNDIVDKKSDREHPSKKNRPIATGKVSNNFAIKFSTTIFFVGKLILYSININLLIFSSLYVVITLFYSYKIKYIKYLDILSVTFLFLVRLVIGGVAIEIEVSTPLFLFVFFTCLGIVSSKKYSILNNNELRNSKVKKFLIANYKDQDLKNVIHISFIFSIITYTSWIILNNRSSLLDTSSTILYLSLIIYVFIIYEIIQKTYLLETEEIIEMMISNNKMLLFLLIFLFLFVLGTI
jgi:decaprenyl-phosphate phosphoribosyltransferase